MALAAMHRGIAREYVLADALPDIAATMHTLARPEAWRAVEETLSRFASRLPELPGLASYRVAHARN